MVLIDKAHAIRQTQTVPILCHSCGQQSSLEEPTEEICDALVTASYIAQFEQETALLQRTQMLFDRFPKSQHPDKLSKEYLTSKRPQPQPDPQFETALDKDAELKDFLKTHGFWLPARSKAVREALKQWKAELSYDVIRCASCNKGHYRIEPDFFDRLM